MHSYANCKPLSYFLRNSHHAVKKKKKKKGEGEEEKTEQTAMYNLQISTLQKPQYG